MRTLVPAQERAGIKGLLFSGTLEDDFRKYYSHSGTRRSRLMPAFTIMMTVLSIILHLTEDDPSIASLIFNSAIMLPLLIATLFLSTRPDRYRWYQSLLAVTGTLSGLLIVSIAYRPSLPDMPSYFSMETAWVFAIWLILGLRFRIAAATALTVSAAHVSGMLYMNYEIQQTGYEIVMLLLVNGIGAVACYHIEYAMRMAFMESREVSALASELAKLAKLDGLTGLNNRRSFDAHFQRTWDQSRREQVPLAVMLIDIDHFKKYNDHYGHQQGDDTLVSVARVIAAGERRPLDIAARYGGEEFVLVLYGQDSQTASLVAESLRTAIGALKIPHADSTTGQYLTVSVGVAIIMPDAERSCAGAVQMADEALYQAKEDGRDRVHIKDTVGHMMSTGCFRADLIAGAKGS